MKFWMNIRKLCNDITRISSCEKTEENAKKQKPTENQEPTEVEIKKTCMNCNHHHYVVSDPESFFHIHDYCDVWQKAIPSWIIFDREGCESGATDIEAGLAECWGFEPKEKEIVAEFPKLGTWEQFKMKKEKQD